MVSEQVAYSHSKSRKIFAGIKTNTYFPSIIAVILLFLLGRTLSNGFLSVNNVSSILLTSAILSLAAMGQAIVIISGNNGLDMSLGAIMSMTALLGPMVKTSIAQLDLLAMLIVCIMLGAFIGLLNGAGTRFLKIPPLVMTLIMSNVVNGFALFVTRGQPVVDISKRLQSICAPLIGPIRTLTAIVIVFVILMEIFLFRKSKYGRSLFISGNNANAASLCGINVNLTVIMAYVIGGAIAGAAGLFLVAYAGSAQMQMAKEYTMLSIASVVIGGTKLTGGKGGFIGGTIGALVLVLLTSILQALNMPAGVRSLIQGLILLLILLANCRSPKHRQ
jgi:ribose transport system permease protein